MVISPVLSKQVAIVTGAGRGIGRAIAIKLAEQGAAVVATARNATEIAETVNVLRQKGGRALGVVTDVSEPSSVQELIQTTCNEFETIDILVNNAGIQGPIGPLVENDITAWVQTIQINLIGTFLCCKAFLPYMIDQNYGRIINLAGGGATTPRPNFSAYAASKVALVRLTETLAEEVKAYNIQVNAVAPGAVNTRMLEQTLQAGQAAGEKGMAEARRQLETGGTPPELAAALVVFLASATSDGITGKLIAAPYDGWQEWDSERIQELMALPWLTLRRMDPFTLKPFLEILDH